MREFGGRGDTLGSLCIIEHSAGSDGFVFDGLTGLADTKTFGVE